MDVREKLVELLKEIVAIQECGFGDPRQTYETVASYLMSHGVTVQEWVSANEPPKENCKRVLIALRWDDTDIGWYDKEDKCWRSEYVNCYDVGEVTHWQPMPQPPKGE